MSESIVIQPHHPTARLRRVHPLLAGALLGFVIGALGLAIAVSTVDVVRAALVSDSVEDQAQPYPNPELPREWREWKQGVDVEHMYRQKQTPRLDWIRENGGR